MKELFFKGPLVATLLVGIAVLGFGSTQGGFQLPGREVDSIEACTIKGAGCGGFADAPCTGCGGSSAMQTSGGKSNEANGGGCASNCVFNATVTATCGS